MSMFARRLALAVTMSCGAFGAHAQCVSIQAVDTAVTQNFDGLSNVAGSTTNNLTLPGWFMTETGGGARDNEQYAVDTGASNTGDTFSYGAAGSSDRALGSLRSGTLIASYGACYTNTTGAPILSLDIAYTGEQWRLGTAARTDQLTFEYSLDAASLTTGAWSAVTALNFVTPNTATTGAKDGNAVGNRTSLSANIGQLSIANGATFWIRWSDADGSGADDGLAVDDTSLIARGTGGGVVTPAATIADTALAEGDSGLKPAFFTVTLDRAAGAGGVSIDYATADGTATAGSDYVAKTGTLTIAEGATSATLSVDLIGDTTTEADETFVVNLSNPVGATIGDAQATGTITNDDVSVTPISAIQGSGRESPVVGQTVFTRGIVTGRRVNGFYIQIADGAGDGDDATSEGLYVFTNAAPPADAAIGNLVQVQGAIAEFIPTQDLGQLPLTEMVSPTVTVLGTGNALPTPVQLSTALPSPAGGLDQLERFEGMRATAASFTVVAPTSGSTNEPNATGTSNGIFSVVVTGTPRPFREPGIQAPDLPPSGSIPPIPRFDYNPETLTVTSRTLGGPALDVRAGTTITGLVGPLDYSFRHYTILPDASGTPVIGTQPTPTAARLPTSDEFTVASYNAERFFDTQNDPATGEPVLTSTAFANRLNKASLAIRDFLNTPDIIGLVEIENLTTLQAIASKIGSDAVANGQPDPQYVAYLQEGNDVGGIDVGFLVKSAEVAAGVDRVEVVAVTQLGKDTTFVQPDGTSALLNDRPPLQLDAVVHYADGRTFPITTMVIHNRSLNDAGTAGATGDRVRVKRQKQAEFVANAVQALQVADPTRRIALVGDFNAFEFNDGFGDSMGTITGMPAADNATVVPDDGVDLVNPDLLNLFTTVTADQRYSYVFDGNAQSLDHVLVNQALGTAADAVELDHARINADFTEVDRNDSYAPTRLSDHDPAVAYVKAEPVTFADLAVTASATPTSVAANGAMRFDASIANNGPDAAEFPGAGFALDAELANLVVTAPSGWTCDAPEIANGTTSVACAATTLANAATAAFVLTANAPASESGGTIVLSASASSQTTDSVPANDNASATVSVAAVADLGITLIGSSTAPRSSVPLPYVARIANAGPSAAPATTVTLKVDALKTYVTLTAPSGWTCTTTDARSFDGTCTTATPVASGSQVDFNLGVVTNGRLAPVAFTVSGTVSSAANDPTAGNNAASKRASRSAPR